MRFVNLLSACYIRLCTANKAVLFIFMTAQRNVLSWGHEAFILILYIIPYPPPRKSITNTPDDELCQILHLITKQVHCIPFPAILVLWSNTTETRDVRASFCISQYKSQKSIISTHILYSCCFRCIFKAIRWDGAYDFPMVTKEYASKVCPCLQTLAKNCLWWSTVD